MTTIIADVSICLARMELSPSLADGRLKFLCQMGISRFSDSLLLLKAIACSNGGVTGTSRQGESLVAALAWVDARFVRRDAIRPRRAGCHGEPVDRRGHRWPVAVVHAVRVGGRRIDFRRHRGSIRSDCALIWSVLIYSVFTALCGFAQTAAQLAIFRIFLGIGMGGEWASGAALVSETWPDRHRGKALAFVQSSWADRLRPGRDRGLRRSRRAGLQLACRVLRGRGACAVRPVGAAQRGRSRNSGSEPAANATAGRWHRCSPGGCSA